MFEYNFTIQLGYNNVSSFSGGKKSLPSFYRKTQLCLNTYMVLYKMYIHQASVNIIYNYKLALIYIQTRQLYNIYIQYKTLVCLHKHTKLWWMHNVA